MFFNYKKVVQKLAGFRNYLYLCNVENGYTVIYS